VEDAACVEDRTDGGGCHLWLVLELAEVPQAVAGMTVPRDAVPGTGAVRRVPVDRPDVMSDLLERPTVLATLSVLDGGAEPVAEHLLALGPGGCWLAEREPTGTPWRDLAFYPVDPDWVVRRVQEVLGTGRDLARPTGDPSTGPAGEGRATWGEGTMAG
jgi:hypothetical protein